MGRALRGRERVASGGLARARRGGRGVAPPCGREGVLRAERSALDGVGGCPGSRAVVHLNPAWTAGFRGLPVKILPRGANGPRPAPASPGTMPATLRCRPRSRTPAHPAGDSRPAVGRMKRVFGPSRASTAQACRRGGDGRSCPRASSMSMSAWRRWRGSRGHRQHRHSVATMARHVAGIDDTGAPAAWRSDACSRTGCGSPARGTETAGQARPVQRERVGVPVL